MNRQEARLHLMMIESIPEDQILQQISEALKNYNRERTPENKRVMRKCMHIFSVKNAMDELGGIEVMLDKFNKLDFANSLFTQSMN